MISFSLLVTQDVIISCILLSFWIGILIQRINVEEKMLLNDSEIGKDYLKFMTEKTTKRLLPFIY